MAFKPHSTTIKYAFMKKTCSGCRAFIAGVRGLNPSCQLGFKIEVPALTGMNNVFNKAIPKEECPKPKTLSEYMFHFKKSRK